MRAVVHHNGLPLLVLLISMLQLAPLRHSTNGHVKQMWLLNGWCIRIFKGVRTNFVARLPAGSISMNMCISAKYQQLI